MEKDVKRIFEPLILREKQELLTLLKSGKMKYSKYNVLSEEEKLFVELVVFGGYSGEQAVRVIDPNVKNPKMIANRMAMTPDVAATLDELSVQRDKKFVTELNEARELALSKLMYIMHTTSDEALAAAAAKTILDTSGKATAANNKKEDERVDRVRYEILVENAYLGPQNPLQPIIQEVIIPIDDAAAEEYKTKTQAEINRLNEELVKEKENLAKVRQANNRLPVNPETGLPYTISYEGVDNYHDNEEE